jgi:hypothetical protein
MQSWRKILVWTLSLNYGPNLALLPSQAFNFLKACWNNMCSSPQICGDEDCFSSMAFIKKMLFKELLNICHFDLCTQFDAQQLYTINNFLFEKAITCWKDTKVCYHVDSWNQVFHLKWPLGCIFQVPLCWGTFALSIMYNAHSQWIFFF